jgi:hypothetical protein
MFDIYSYEQVQAANAERLSRALIRYERLGRSVPEPDVPHGASEENVLEIVFATGCPGNDQLSA